MGFLSKLFKSPIFKVVAPLALSPLLGPMGFGLSGSALTAASTLGGAGLGALGGGGVKGAALGGLGGFAGGGGFGTPASSINWTSAAPGFSTGVQNFSGSGVLGSLGKAGSNLSSLFGSSGMASGGSIFDGLKEVTSGSLSGLFGNPLVAGANIYSGIQGTSAYKDMAKAQQAGNNQAIAALSPFASTGTAANQRLSSLLGLSGDASGQLQSLRDDPGYQFRLQEGEKALNRSLGAQGKLFSGQALKAGQEYGQGLADQTYNDAVQRLSSASAAGQNAASAMGGLYQDTGNITANSILGRNNTVNQSLANLLGSSVGNASVGGQNSQYYISGYDAQGQPIYKKVGT